MSIAAKPWEGGGSASVPDASETTKGKIRIATSSEAATGTDDLTAMTPLTVKERIDASLVGGVEYKGTFNATAGTPSLLNAEQGDLYVIDVAGSIYGQDWSIGDQLLINADMGGTISNSKINKVDNTQAVTSVNTQTGAVTLTASDVGALASGDNVSELTNDSGYLTSAPVSSVNTQTGAVTLTASDVGALASGDNVSELTNDSGYLTSAPVSSVNTQTGAVTLTASDVGALASGDNVSELTNDSGYLTSAPVSSVNTQTGAVTLTASDVGALASGDNVSELTNDSGYLTSAPVSSVNTQTGAVALSGDDLTADHTAQNYTATNANINGHLAGIDSALGGSANPTLDGVTDNGNTTTNAINVGTVTTSGNLLADVDATRTIGAENTRFYTAHTDLNGAVRFKAKNDQGSAITKGQVVYIKGVSGTVPTVGLAKADSASTMPAFGLALANANDQAEVQIVTFGNLTDYDTTTYSLSANDTVFVSAATAGALTNSAPSGEANLIQNIGRVVRADSSAGIIKVGGAGRSAATPNLDQDKIFVGNASNQAVSTALSAIDLSSFNNDLPSGVTQLNDLSDVSITGAATGEVLRYSGSAWVDATLAYTDISGTPTLAAVATSGAYADLSGTPTTATETTEGIIELATNAEAQAASATDKALVPSNIGSIDTGDLNDDGTFLKDLSEDTTPQLGGNLDVNGNLINSVSNGDIEVAPNGTGSFKVQGNATSGSGRIVLNCEQNSHGITLKGPPHSAAADYTLTLPNTDGSADQVLKTDGSGVLDWVDQSGGGGGGYTYSAISATTTAQASYHYSVDTSAGAFALNLPALAGLTDGEEIRVKLRVAGNDLTLDANGTETIDGAQTLVLSVATSSVTLVVGSTEWEVV